MLRGIMDYTRLHGPWSLYLNSGGPNEQKMPDLREWRGSGIIARVPNAQVAADIVAARVPTVLIDPLDDYLAPGQPLARYSRFQGDSVQIARRAADHFGTNGFANYAFVGEPSGMNWSRWREAAYLQRLQELGFSCVVYSPPDGVEQADWLIERKRMCGWLAGLPKPLAVFAANDSRGRQVLDACLMANLPVPYEVAVLGVNNDVMICESGQPPLSSVDVDAQGAGYAAAELLDRLMGGQLTGQQCRTYGAGHVVPRASTQRLQVSDPLVIEALEFIRANAGLNIRVSDIAEQLTVSSRWIEKRFKQTLGRAVKGEIQRVRMNTVSALVKETELPFAGIAERCGFRSANHLGVIFRREWGCTMSDFRLRPNGA